MSSRRQGEDREAHLARGRAEAKARYDADPEKYRARARASRARTDRAKVYRRHQLSKLYGLTLEAYEALSEGQGGVCAICLGPPSGPGAKNGRLHVDHDHITGAIRGLLCSRCNTAIGLLDDDSARVAKRFSLHRKESPMTEPGFDYTRHAFEHVSSEDLARKYADLVSDAWLIARELGNRANDGESVRISPEAMDDVLGPALDARFIVNGERVEYRKLEKEEDGNG